MKRYLGCHRSFATEITSLTCCLENIRTVGVMQTKIAELTCRQVLTEQFTEGQWKWAKVWNAYTEQRARHNKDIVTLHYLHTVYFMLTLLNRWKKKDSSSIMTRLIIPVWGFLFAESSNKMNTDISAHCIFYVRTTNSPYIFNNKYISCLLMKRVLILTLITNWLHHEIREYFDQFFSRRPQWLFLNSCPLNSQHVSYP